MTRSTTAEQRAAALARSAADEVATLAEQVVGLIGRTAVLVGPREWSTQVGRDRATTLAAALCDAAAELTVLADEVERLCSRTEAVLAAADRRE